MRNNKLFIAMPSMSDIKMDALRVRLESSEALFDMHGDAEVAVRNNHFGFSTVVPKESGGKVRCFFRMLGCSYVYLPRGWHVDRCSRKAFAWAEFFGKKVIFEEDGVCR